MRSEQEHDELLMSLVESVREFPPGEREAQLRAVCSDSALSEEVLTRIEWEERMKGFLLDPLFPRPAAEDTFAAGTYLGRRFRIVREIGRGGMGIVYEAMDKELDGRVALKCAKPGHSSRLPPEARAAREVSHFNVCKVHDLHKVSTEFGEMDFLSMEYIEGETLSARLARDGRLREDVAFEIALQICAGLAQAHRQGVIHGDIKCSNILLGRSPEGGMRAVITDFGLAKLKFADGSELLGAQGGTFDYMAPELFRGEPPTVASDVYALGVLFHTMLAGHAPERVHPSLARGLVETWIAGSNASTVILDRKIASDDWERKIAELPSPWKKIVKGCLSARPGNRFASAEDIRLAFTRRAPWIKWAAVGAVAAVAALAWFVWAGNQGSQVDGLLQLTSSTDLSGSPSLSRDGKTIVYESDRAEPGNLDIWVQPLPGGEARRLTAGSAEDNDPSISPDGKTVAFRSERNGGAVYLVDATGGNERLLALNGRNPQFSPDGQRILYWVGDRNESSPSGRIYVIPVTGGAPRRLAAEFEDARLPIWNSDGRSVLFSGCKDSGRPLRTCMDWWVADAEGTGLTKTGAMPLLREQEITPADAGGVWEGDTLIFSGRRQGADSLWELSISQPQFRAAARPRQLTSVDSGATAVAIAENGSIAIGRMSGALHVWRIGHAATSLMAPPAKVTGEGASDISPNVSHNGRWLVFGRRYGKYREIWLKDLWSGKETVQAISKFNKASPIVDDTGTAIVYEQQEPKVSTIWLARGQNQRELCTACSNPTAWFGDGAFFYSEGGSSKIMLMDIRTATPRVAVDADFPVNDADWSGANQYLLFTASPDGSRKQVFAARFPLAGAQPAKDWIAITSESEWSDRPRWSGDGKTIFFLTNRDGFRCIWAQRFDPVLGKMTGPAFPVTHYHNPRLSPDRVRQRSFNMSVSADSIFLNLGEEAESIWIGNLKPGHFVHRIF